MRLFGQLSGFKRNLFAAGQINSNFLFHDFSLDEGGVQDLAVSVERRALSNLVTRVRQTEKLRAWVARSLWLVARSQ